MSQFVEKLKTAPNFVCMKPVESDEIDKAEESLGVHFANEYRELISACGAASIDGHEITGICSSKRLNVVQVTTRARIENPAIPCNMYVIEEMHIDGILIWQNESGNIYISKPGADVEKGASSLLEYLKL